MKIHSLAIQGFGPFKDKQEIDFDLLSQDKIFMLEGPTGAGKSSIIDAIVFALYGVTAHEAATKSGPAGQRVRSDYCEANDETKVVMEFTSSGSRYKVTRTAAYDAPKKNGEGTTPVNAKATLEFIAPAYEAINQVREVNLRIKEELRMDNEQFSQMVVLPQGDFASFLHASTEKRREILDSIFKTFFYDKIKGQFEIKAKEIQNFLASQNQEIKHHVRNLEKEWDQTKDDFDFNRLEEILNDKNSSKAEQDRELQKAMDVLEPDTKSQSLQVSTIEKELAPLKAEIIVLEDSNEKISNKLKLSQELESLKLRKDEIAQKESQLLIRQKASNLQIILDTRNSAADSMQENLGNIDADYSEMTASEVKERIKELNKTVPILRKKVDETSRAEEEIVDLESKIYEVSELEAMIKTLPSLKIQNEKLEKKISVLKSKLVKYRTLERSSYVVDAAKMLKNGKPCPVCGSKEHPKPVSSKNLFKQDVLEELESELSVSEQEKAEAKIDLRNAVATSKKQFKPTSGLKAKLKILQKLIAQAESTTDQHDEADQELTVLNDELAYFISYEAAEKTYIDTNQKLLAELKKFKIPDVDALLDILVIDEKDLSEEITGYRDRVKAINTILTQSEYQKLPESNQVQIKIDLLTKSIGDLEQNLGLLNNQLAVADRVNASLNTAKDGINGAIANSISLRESGDPYLKLQDWVSGKNVAGLSLTNFVLQERLEMILEFASRHLRRISNGKYEFRLYEEKQGRTQKAGLGITIMDYFAGKERPAETLSGGETFYASLALALGLVEVVKGDNGGIELGTLFIDEGFGSLSEDTLEEVLDVLEDLREERVIGIISHVEGMKTQIPMRLEVRPTPAGPSTLEMAITSNN